MSEYKIRSKNVINDVTTDDCKVISGICFDQISSLDKNVFMGKDLNEKGWHLINPKERIVSNNIYNDISSSGTNLLYIVKIGDKYSVIDSENNMITQFDYDVINKFEVCELYNDVAWIERCGLVGLIDTFGTEIIQPKYETMVHTFREIFGKNVAKVTYLGKEIYVDIDGKEYDFVWKEI